LSDVETVPYAETRAARIDPRWLAAGGLLGLLIWTYLPILRILVREWQKNPNYSVGQLVPFAALYMLWTDRQQLARLSVRPAWIGGLALIILAQGIRFYGLMYLYESLERYSVIFTIAGIVLLAGGWAVLQRTVWVILFLFLMIPLPERVHNLISGPLQDLATHGAVMTLELMGVTVEQQGHVMQLNGTTPVAVAEACSGLRMLTAFIMVSAVFAYIVNRPAWQKLVLLASSIPIAILCNLVRLVVTALLFMWTTSSIANQFFHDFAGLTMMPLAVFMLMGELWLLSKLVIEEQREPAKISL
jgi:exosortase